MSETESTTLRGSSKLRLMLEEVKQAFAAYKDAQAVSKKARGYAKKIVQEVYNQAIKEGFSPEYAKELIFSNVTAVSQRTLYLYLPEEAKNKQMQVLAKKRSKNRNAAAPLQLAATRLEAMRQKGKRILASEISAPGTLSLKNELAMKVYDALKKDRTAQFLLTHDGKVVLSVEIESILQDPSHVMQETATVVPNR